MDSTSHKNLFSNYLDKSLNKNFSFDLKLSTDSETSIELLKILNFFWFNSEKTEIDKNQFSMELIIGNKALDFFYTNKDSETCSILDLSEYWKKITDLPFVFAVWQSIGEVDPNFIKLLHSSVKEAERKMVDQPCEYLEPLTTNQTKKDQLTHYWQKIYYSISSHEETSLRLFLNLSNYIK